ncbi:unnamed protein product, partial [Polarella glacialis]
MVGSTFGRGLPADLQLLQAEVLAGLDSGSSDDDDQDHKLASGRESSSGSALALDVLSEAQVLEVSGEESVENVQQLVFRERGLTSLFTSGTVEFSRFLCLEVLSLSHNQLTDISPLSAVACLAEVNLNFNRIEDISPLYECEQLVKIFASHNQISGIAGLEVGCPQIQELSLFANCFSDSSSSQSSLLATLRSLPELRALDVGQNPCSAALRQELLRDADTRLELLDGQRVSDLLCRQRVSNSPSSDAAPGDRPASGADCSTSSRPSSQEAEFTDRMAATTGSSASEANTWIEGRKEESEEDARPGTAPAAGRRSVPLRPPLPPRVGSGSGSGLHVAQPLLGQKMRSMSANRFDDLLTSASRSGSREPSNSPPAALAASEDSFFVPPGKSLQQTLQ